MITDQNPLGRIVSNLALWLCCMLSAINILAALAEGEQFQTFLVFLILWCFALALVCFAGVITLFARLPGWKITAECAAITVVFIAANAAGIGLTMP